MEETVGLGSFLESLIDVIGINITLIAGSQEVGVDVGVFRATVGEDVMDTAGERFDWAGGRACAFHMDGFTLNAILLVSNAKRGFNCSVQGDKG